MTREEAIKNVKTFFEGIDISLCNLTKESFNTLIPELAESENERIRKDIIAFIKAVACKTAISEEREGKWISYLEKQKEQKSRIDACGFPLRDEGESACSYLERCLSPDMRNIWYEACSEIKEKQKEQKPLKVGANAYFTPEQKPAEWSEDIIRKAVKEVGLTQHQIDWFKTNVFPPKQEWSEEDKRMLSRCIKSVDCSKQFAESETFKKAKDAEITWLKSLPMNLKKKNEDVAKLCSNEWSEEDKKIIDTIVSVLGQYMDYKAVSDTGSGSAYATPRYSKEIDWLNSLRPSWKPSEEQMEALKEASASWMNARMGNAKLLKSLYEQLKKLM